MYDTPDGVIPLVLGIPRGEGWYDAFPGEVEFHEGKLVRVRVADRRGWHNADRPLTAGFTYFPDLTPGSTDLRSGAGDRAYVRCRGITRVYAGGVLADEKDLGEVNVGVTHLTG